MAWLTKRLSTQRKREIHQKLQRKQKGKCFWCGDKIVSVNLLPQGSIIGSRMHQSKDALKRVVVCYKDKDTGEVTTKKRASLDHLNPRVNGGQNYMDNFVLSCLPCNELRSGL